MRAVRWMNGAKKNLGTLGGRNSVARGINAYGVIVGWSETAAGKRQAFIWKDGVMTDLGTLGGATSEAHGINRSGTIVGFSATPSGEQHAFRWKDGVFKDLGTQNYVSSGAGAINTKGQIAGLFGAEPDALGDDLEATTGFVYYQEAFTRLPYVGSRSAIVPRGIGPTGIVVGSALDTGSDPGEEKAFYWEPGTGAVLPTLDPSIKLDNHAGADGVNRAGTIVGFSVQRVGARRAVAAAVGLGRQGRANQLPLKARPAAGHRGVCGERAAGAGAAPVRRRQ